MAKSEIKKKKNTVDRKKWVKMMSNQNNINSGLN